MEYVSMILNALLGGSLIVTLVTLRPARRKANAEAKASDLDNIQEIIGIWKKAVEDLKVELAETRERHESLNESMQRELEGLRRAVARLTNVNNRMVKLLDKITPENLEAMVEQIKQIHNEG
jgi:predicted  nucleic acid-binding Zn-ribbon protein